MDWGNPETWENLKDHVQRKQYTFGFTENPRTPSKTVSQVLTFFKLYFKEFTPWLALLPLLGLWPLWKRDKYHFGLLMAVFCIISFGFILILNFKLDKQSIWLNNVFWIPAYMVAAILMGSAINFIGSIRLSKVKLLPVAVIVSIACVILPLTANYYRNDKSEYWFAYDFCVNILDTLDENAIYFPAADHATFPILYMQAVEGMRTDVTIANKYGYPEEYLYADMPQSLRGKFRKIPTNTEEMIIEDWVITQNPDRPVYFTKKRPLTRVPGARLEDVGLAYKVIRQKDGATEDETAAKSSEALWASYNWHTLDEEDIRGELSAEFVMSDYHFSRGRYYLNKGEEDNAVASFDKAIEIAGENKEGLNNLGSACAEGGVFDAAERYLSRAYELDPEYDMGMRNLGKVYMQTNQFDRAELMFDAIIELDPNDPEALWLSSKAMQNLKRYDKALARLVKLAEVTPQDPKVFKEMGMIYFNLDNSSAMARQMFIKSLQLNPDQPELRQMLHQNPMPQQPGQTEMNPMPEIPGMPQEAMTQLPSMPTMPQVPQIPQQGMRPGGAAGPRGMGLGGAAGPPR